jgi:hypothetical protein
MVTESPISFLLLTPHPPIANGLYARFHLREVVLTPDNGSNLPWDTINVKAPRRVIWWGFFVAVCSGG